MIRQAFNRAGAKPEGASGIDFLEAILRERPDLRDKPAYFPGDRYSGVNDNQEGHWQGQCSHTVFIGDEVFKGPKTQLDASLFDTEPMVLKELLGKGVAAPQVTCVGKETKFYGMKRLSGVELPRDFMKTLTQEQIQALAKDMAEFIVGMAQALPKDERGRWMGHADLQPKNILIDPETKKLTGVIDFGLVEYSPHPKATWGFDEMAEFNRLIYSHEKIAKVFGVQAQKAPASKPGEGRAR